MNIRELVASLEKLDQALPVAFMDNQGLLSKLSPTIGVRTIDADDAEYCGEFETEVGKKYAVVYEL